METLKKLNFHNSHGNSVYSAYILRIFYFDFSSALSSMFIGLERVQVLSQNWNVGQAIDYYLSVCLSDCPEDSTWMVVQHNNTELTRLRASSATDRRLIYFDYSAAEEQLSAAIRQSEHCEQELSYRCKKSRLLNTPGRHRAQWKTHTCDPLIGNQTLD